MILAIETSCDDTCAAVLTHNEELLSSIVSSQHDVHSEFQGVVPELASRRHCVNVNYVLNTALKRAGVKLGDLEGVAVTYGPGLVGSLLTGIAAAKSISARFNLPLIPVNHIEAHIYSILLEHKVEYPFISLVASGGHTALFVVKSADHYEVIGHTRDDAAGEAYDKVAKMLSLGYPGGPAIQEAAETGDPRAIDFPRPTMKGSRWTWNITNQDFSYSGIKTAVYYYLDDHQDYDTNDVAASFQRAVNDTLVHKTIQTALDHNIDRICVGGGVAANGPLRESFQNQASSNDRNVFFPSMEFCTDNAAMIGLRANQIDITSDLSLNAQPSLSVFSPGSDKREELVV